MIYIYESLMNFHVMGIFSPIPTQPLLVDFLSNNYVTRRKIYKLHLKFTVAWSKAAVAQNRLPPEEAIPRVAMAPGSPTAAMARPRRRIRASVPPGAPLLPSPRPLTAPGIPLAIPGFPLAAPSIPLAAPLPQDSRRPLPPPPPPPSSQLPHRRFWFPWLPDLMRRWPVLVSRSTKVAPFAGALATRPPQRTSAWRPAVSSSPVARRRQPPPTTPRPATSDVRNTGR
ncbi:hypothetical protein PAPYR_5463 [Paratrimastix pyriformis]|uniref:Uncharacterized protein n=1 Tax=Paratrimastix pyriformis TaxID=342808 RepID=A0ABQ8UHI1_9EUKA|nr:hypothetical protein PAPYR_5463 [Paratrimastix pyriformis]